jgi:branched-subunit amino acid aminotransferase/4-amino-4-deoxychorismate lyase
MKVPVHMSTASWRATLTELSPNDAGQQQAVPAEAETLATLALVNYGHFTTMQIRSAATRGLAHHLRRVDAAHRELFGHGLDIELVRRIWAEAATQQPDASLRATLFDTSDGKTHMLVVLRPPREPATGPVRLRSVRYVRPFAHLKHVGMFAQIRYGEDAEKDGYDDALLVTADRSVAETTVANIGFVDESRIVWPSGPTLHGTGQQLLEFACSELGLAVGHAPVHLSELSKFNGAFIVNSSGVAPVGQIDDHSFPEPEQAVRQLISMHERLPWDRLAT